MSETSEATRESAYDIVSFGNTWAILSLGFSLLALFSRRVIGLLPWQYQGYYLMPPLVVLVVPPLAACGLFTGWLALRRDRSSLFARLGLLLNAVILLLSSLLVLGVLVYRRVLV